jgi:glycerophosphoryl diester phosphodiesterase
MQIFAHRGDSFHAPENTIEAAERGLAAGADAWEFDVQLTRDGVPIVLHDASLRRTTDVATRFADDPRAGRGFLAADFDLDEIQTLDAGAWFVRPEGAPRSAASFGTLQSLEPDARRRFASGSVRIPTLAEALDWTRSRRWHANVELKSCPSADPRRIERIVGVLKDADMEGRLLISAFDHADLVAIRQVWHDVPLGALAATPLANVRRYLEGLGARFYHVSREIASSRGEVPIGDGFGIHVYTVNDVKEAADLAAFGIDGIFTDDPASMVLRLDARKHAAPEGEDPSGAARAGH